MWYLGHRKYENWAYHSNLFSEEDCNEIIRYCKTLEQDEGRVALGVVADIRQNFVRWIKDANADNEWIYRRLVDGITTINEQYWNFDLKYIESLQFTEYTEIGHHYRPHLDIGNHMTTYRKLSFSVQLSPETDYEGCELKMHVGGPEPQGVCKEQGSVTYFPSYSLHEVTPLIKGTRYALVGWVDGPDFK